MDFIFEDEVDEVGSDVEAYCPKCKADTTHVVISKYEDEIRRVQCNPCGDVHSFRKPRGETEDDVPEPVAARKRALLKKPGWAEFFARKNPNDARPYEFRELYRENLIVSHPKFGVGFVSEVVSDSKVEITFEDARRILVHNRRDIPALPLAAEGDGMPTPPKSSKPAKGAAKAAKAEAARPEAKAEPEAATPKSNKDKSSKDKGSKAAASAAAEEPSDIKITQAPARGASKAEKAGAKPEAVASKNGKPDLKVVKGGAAAKATPPVKAAPTGKAAAPVKTAPATKPAKPMAKEAAKTAAAKSGKGGKPSKGAAAIVAKSPGKAGKSAAAPRGSKTASRPAAKKPAPKPKKKAGKKR